MTSLIGTIIIIWSLIGMSVYLAFNDYWPKKLSLRVVLCGPLMWYTYAAVVLRMVADKKRVEKLNIRKNGEE